MSCDLGGKMVGSSIAFEGHAHLAPRCRRPLRLHGPAPQSGLLPPSNPAPLSSQGSAARGAGDGPGRRAEGLSGCNRRAQSGCWERVGRRTLAGRRRLPRPPAGSLAASRSARSPAPASPPPPALSSQLLPQLALALAFECLACLLCMSGFALPPTCSSTAFTLLAPSPCPACLRSSCLEHKE